MEKRITPGFHHLTLVAGNASRTRAFYADLLGLSMVKKTVNFDDTSSYHLYFGDPSGKPGTILTFFEWPNAGRGAWGIGGVHHLALGVGTVEAQLRWKRRLTDAGVSVSGPYDRGYFQSIYFRDPDGQILEIATDGPGYAIDEPLEKLGERLIQPDPVRLPSGRNEKDIGSLTHPEPVPTVTSAMLLTGIHHVSGISGDLQRAGDFYEAALGLRLVKKTLNQDDGKTEHFFWANYDGKRVNPHSSLTLFGWPSGSSPARTGIGQTHHLAFRASSDEEQEAWQDHLRSLGVEVSPIQDRKYFRSIYFRDPDGLLLEIATDGPGFAVDEPPDGLGRTLQLPTWLEGDRARIQRTLTPV